MTSYIWNEYDIGMYCLITICDNYATSWVCKVPEDGVWCTFTFYAACGFGSLLFVINQGLNE